MKTNYEVLSIKGKIRPVNQDNYYVNGWTKKMEDNDGQSCGSLDKEYQIFAVCDGMGGEEAGEVAAAIAIEHLYHYSPKSFENHWSDYIDEANRKICEYEDTHNMKMGTTFASLYITPDKVISINVGDSRIYQIRDGKIRQLTKDHNEYQTMLESGIIADEKRMKKAKSRLTQCLGIPESTFKLEPYVVELEAAVEGDIYLLCSDGLYGVLSEEQIINTVLSYRKQKNCICKNLVEIAEKCGSRDNITAMVVYVDKSRSIFAKSQNMIKKFLNSRR